MLRLIWKNKNQYFIWSSGQVRLRNQRFYLFQKMSEKNNLIFSLLLGIFGIISLFFQWNSLYPFAYPSSSYVRELLEKFLHFLPLPVHYYIAFASGFVFFFSIIGIFLGIKCLNYKRNLAILAIILNLINLLLSLFISWFLFGIAGGI